MPKDTKGHEDQHDQHNQSHHGFDRMMQNPKQRFGVAFGEGVELFQITRFGCHNGLGMFRIKRRAATNFAA